MTWGRSGATGGELAVPRDLGATARGWDDQQVALRAAAAQVEGAGTAGFTPAVAAAAHAFVATWSEALRDRAETAGTQADGLRASLADYLATDAAAAADHLVHHFLTEPP
jgi:hypothetical protein